MKLGWTDEQRELGERMRRLGEELGHDVPAREETCTLRPGDWKLSAEGGVLQLPLPEEYGGRGLSPLTCAYALENLGYGCRDNGLMMALGAHIWAVELPIREFGTPEQKQRYLPALGDGRMKGAHAITEAGAGSDALALTARARRDGDDYILDGVKRYITNAPIADLFLVYATVDPDLGFTGVTAFLVERDQAGVSVETRRDKTGLRTAPWGEITLRECRVPAARRLGAEKQGSRVLARCMAWERALILAPMLGTMRRQVEECVEYARTRVQFRKNIGRFESVSHRVVDMRVRLEEARLLTYRAASDLVADPRSIFPEAAQLRTSESAVETFLDAMQVYGGLGYTTGTDVERNLRDALGTRISSGTSDLQRTVIAERLGLTTAARRPGTRRAEGDRHGDAR